MLPWKDIFDKESRAFQLRLRARVYYFLRIRLGLPTGRADLVQDIYVVEFKTHSAKQADKHTLFGQTN